MSEIAGFDLTPDAGTTLRKMLKLNLYPYLAQFEEVSVGATKVTRLICNSKSNHTMICIVWTLLSCCKVSVQPYVRSSVCHNPVLYQNS